MSNIHYFGIRHHGPGSSKRVLAALQELNPSCVLIEGPTDCSELLPLLSSNDMRLPVALLAYAQADANASIFYPFAEFSPEYQATLYAMQNKVDLAFIDIPVNILLAQQLAEQEHVTKLSEDAEDNEEDNEDTHNNNASSDKDNIANSHELETPPVLRDPIGQLAQLAGYEDGEAWWNDLIEQNASTDSELFETIEKAMQSLRQSVCAEHPALQRDLVREAYMRLEIAKAKKTATGPIAVVCGAWHVPALKEKHTAKSDRELVKTLPAKLSAKKVRATWVPWTSARLSSASGYGAGVDAPMWYLHLWQQQKNEQAIALWLTNIARQLRTHGHIVSTASVIEATRLCQTLAAVRGRPNTGFEEVRDAVIACLCFGEKALWQQIEQTILLGDRVGQIPANAPLIPLIEDLQLQQKKYKLKPQALPYELSVDLRASAGLGKSTLLHRLNILDIPWGVIANSGTSRGTFREKWQLEWQAEFSVKLVENLVYGSTIEQAASNKIIELMTAEKSLSKLAAAVSHCLESQLNHAATTGIKLLEKQGAHTSDCIELLASIAPLIDVSRYGTARNLSLEQIDELIERLTIQGALSLPYACRALSDDEAWYYRSTISDAHQALLLTDWSNAVESQWWHALETIVDNSQSNLQVAGLASRLLYQAQRLANDDLEVLLGKMLSAAVNPADAAKYFDGFFSNAVDRLLYDDVLLNAIEHWLIGLDEESFIEFLPLFRRIFADLDAMERKRLIDRVLTGRDTTNHSMSVNEQALATWPHHLNRLSSLLKRDKQWQQ